MDEQKFSFSGTFEKTKEYVETRIQLIKLRLIAQSSRLVGAIILDISKLILILFIIFFLSLALGFFFGELFNSYALGFLITGVLFFLVLLIIRTFEPKLEKQFMNLTISKLMSKLEDEEETVEELIKDNPMKEEILNEVVNGSENK